MNCAQCPTPLGPKNRSGLCRRCSCRRMGDAKRIPRKQCLDCGKTLSHKNASGRCAKHFGVWIGKDPDFQRRRAEGIRRKFEDPLHRQKMAAVARRNGRIAANDPVHRARLVEHGRRQYAEHLNTPEVRARNVAAVRASGHKVTEHFLGWCPLEHRAEYRRLTISKRLPAPVARKMIEEQIATEVKRERQRVAALSPFERQMRALENGAQIVANDTRPAFGTPADYGERKWAR